ncbi:MAG: urea ABC transporter ATP-binding subunit UrtE [Deltaproteobacteria bacterium]|nr:urea ABC transporter ATP-binding subunit UrtE [Deltaproteobacteria bacterium]
MLRIENLSFAYGEIKTLHQVNMLMEPKQITCVMGRNGVGKTTLMKNIMGTLQTNSGKIWLTGRDVTHFPANRRAKAGLALVPQGRHIFPKLTVEENLRVGLEAREDRKRNIPDEVYNLFPILKTMSRRCGGDLSGGQQQQLAIARALVGEPKVILLDEPTEGIQPNIIEKIGDVLRTLVSEKDVAVVIVEQFLDFVKEFGDRFYIMNRGTVVADGITEELTENLVTKHLQV